MKKNLPVLALGIVVALFGLSACIHAQRNSYENASAFDRQSFRIVRLPLRKGTHFTVSRGAFADSSDASADPYHWAFAVPNGSSVVAVESGMVMAIGDALTPPSCRQNDQPPERHIKVKHWDGSIAIYDQVTPRVSVGGRVRRGQVIAVTASQRFHCSPDVDFRILAPEQKKKRGVASTPPRGVPLYFQGIPGGLAKEGYEGDVPR